VLKRDTANAVFDLAKQVTDNDISLIPVDESPLTALINACISPSIASGRQVAYSGIDADEFSPESFIGASRLKNSEGASEHDLVMDELIDTIAEAITKNLNEARNDVAPMIEMVHEEAVKAIAEATARGQHPYTLIPYFYGDVWDRDEIQDMAQRYSTIPRNNVRLSVVVPLPEGKSIKDVLSTGMIALDDTIHDILARHGGESWAMSVYEWVFGPRHFAKLEDVLTMNYTDVDVSIIVMLLANALVQTVPEETNMTLDGYKAYMATIQAQAGANVYRILKRRANNVTSQTMVLERPSRYTDAGNLIVNGDVYNRWLDEGGSPEILMGAVIGGRSEGYRDLLADKDANLASYRRVKDQITNELTYAQFNALTASFRKSMTDIINNMEEGDLPVPKSVLFTNLTYRLTRLHMHDLADLHIPARKIVCRTLYHHTDVEKYLEAIETAHKDHPELDIREAAHLATGDIAVQWLLGQLTLVPAK
jgi:hypothetical protein